MSPAASPPKSGKSPPKNGVAASAKSFPCLTIIISDASRVLLSSNLRVSSKIASRPSDAAVAAGPACNRQASARSAVQTGRDRLEPHETRYSSRLSPSNRTLRLRQRLPDSLDNEGRNAARRNLLELPPILHRQAKISRHRRPRRALPKEIRRRRSQIQRRQKVISRMGRSTAAPHPLQDLPSPRSLLSSLCPPRPLC